MSKYTGIPQAIKIAAGGSKAVVILRLDGAFNYVTTMPRISLAQALRTVADKLEQQEKESKEPKDQNILHFNSQDMGILYGWPDDDELPYDKGGELPAALKHYCKRCLYGICNECSDYECECACVGEQDG